MLNKDYLMQPKEVAKELKCSVSSVYRWFWEGKLKGVQIGRKTIRIFSSSIKEILDVKKTYRLDEVAEILRVGKKTIYRMIKDGGLPTVAPGINRISSKVLEKMLGIPEVNNLRSDE